MGLLEKFKNELTDPSIDLLKECGEITIDTFVNNSDLFNKIPIINTISLLYSGVGVIRKCKFEKNIILFLKEFYSGSISQEKFDEMKVLLEDPKKSAEIIEYILLTLEKTDSDRKSILISKAFKKYVNKELSWDGFRTICRAIDALIELDYEGLNSIWSCGGDHQYLYGGCIRIDNAEPIYTLLAHYRLLIIDKCINTDGSKLIDEVISDVYGPSHTTHKLDLVIEEIELGTLTHEGKVLAEISAENSSN